MKKPYNVNGQPVPGEEIEFEVEREGWNTYILHDGTKLKLKSVVSSIIRLDSWKPDGEPVYIVNSSNIAAADVPDNLKKKPD
jgi:hypothetical protein